LPNTFWLPYSNRLLEADVGSAEAAIRGEAEKARANEAARKVTDDRGKRPSRS
jgi:hypothetical protein